MVHLECPRFSDVACLLKSTFTSAWWCRTQTTREVGKRRRARLAFNIPSAFQRRRRFPPKTLSFLAHSDEEREGREREMVKQIHNLVLNRANAKEAFGFRIIGGKEQGLTFKVNNLGLNFEKAQNFH